MKPSRFITYAAAIIIIAGGAIWYIIANYYEQQSAMQGQSDNQVVMYKNPGCECCTAWGEHMEAAGFTVTEKPTSELPGIKVDLGVPYNMGSCHTAVVDDYVVEGHVPAKEVKKMLDERPDAIGLAVPGMPIGSPGMEQGNRVESYDVIIFSEDSSGTYASY